MTRERKKCSNFTKSVRNFVHCETWLKKAAKNDGIRRQILHFDSKIGWCCCCFLKTHSSLTIASIMISYVILRVRTQSMCVQWKKNPLVWKYRARLCYNSHKKPMDNHSRSCAFFLGLFFVQSFHIHTAVCVSLKNHVWFIEYWRIKRNNIYIEKI